MPDDIPFKNRSEAGKLLAKQLTTYAHRGDVVVLALPRGGVPVAYAVADALGVELDILLVRKLGMPGQEEYAMGALGSGGVRVMQPGFPGLMGVTAQQVEAVAVREQAELERRERLYRGSHPPADLRGRTVVLVDDGIATGSSMLVAVQVARQLGAGKVVVAVPVAPPDTAARMAAEVDQFVAVATPMAFRAVGQWYRRFDQTSDEEVQDLLARAWRGQAGQGAGAIDQPNQRTRHEPDDRHRT
ncbi:phosphoribosyltransferase [Massilia terrae]|uniref:Phosphoribosyltransferase n=1 Tax=Massilia terrae TaxID=1811224 RepID=A0ABT2CSK8_9BURK|nr:phosphoribosyltransferase [Massilia terrae]MCS0656952.1 phosphoribosyltransferase [Massilia terrae]